MPIRHLRTIGSNALHVSLKRPSVLRRGGNPVAWAIQRTFAEWRFESVSTNQQSSVAALTGSSVEQVKAIYEALDALPDSSAARQHPLLYALVRLLDPDTIVETGVADGDSSAAMLQALQDNRREGQLFSTDLPPSGDSLADGTRYAPHPKGVG